MVQIYLNKTEIYTVRSYVLQAVCSFCPNFVLYEYG